MKSILKFIFNVQTKKEIFHTKNFNWKQNIAWFTGRSIRNSVIMASFVITGYVSAKIYNAYNPTVQAQTVTIEVPVDNLSPKIEELKQDVLATLGRGCESKGHSTAEALIILDTNNKASIGTFQFQVKTVVFYYKKLYGKVITPVEAATIALDEAKATDLASDVIFKTNDGLTNWINCTKWHNLDLKVDMIKKLMK